MHPTMELKGLDSTSVRNQAATYLSAFDRAARLDAEGNRREPYHHALDQRVPCAAEPLDPALHEDRANGLADLQTDRTIGMGDDAVKFS